MLVLNHEARVDTADGIAGEIRILAMSEDKTMRVWDAESGVELFVLPHENAVLVAEWNPGESRILSVSRSGTVTVFYTQLTELVEVACSRVSRNMNRIEWQRFMTGQPYQATCPNLPAQAAE